ncbi:MAG: flagellar hook-basal body complex protein [Hahellaceae bacterium]|nr:flagellar hook-basal body complex protein [Hahellaceae bacterium]
MPFNVALTGIRAASVDLEVTGNNIANASTMGYKSSRVEFADLYANSYLGLGSNPVGDGVRVQNIRQQFSQGNISFTDNGLDLAINGNGFFIIDDSSGGRAYTRAGAFAVDKDGFVVNSSGSRLQGFPANEEGVLGGVLGDLAVSTTNLPPVRTTGVEAEVNLDATQEVKVERGQTLASDGGDIGVATLGTLNGYTAQTVTVTLADGTTTDIVIPANSEAGAIAAQFNAINGVEASATSQATIPAATFNNSSGVMRVTINGVPFDGATDLTALGNAINNSPSLVGVTAILDSSGDLVVSSSRGNNLQFDFSGDNTDGFDVVGSSAASSSVSLSSSSTQATVGGQINLTLEDGITLASTSSDIFDTFEGTPYVNNAFDPTDEATYNHATSTTIYDSLGNPHVQTMYFVKEPRGSGNESNLWTMYVMIDGRDVGDPLTPGGDPTRAGYSLVFNEDGSINNILSDQILVSNWTPLDANGEPNGAEGPLNVISGGILPIPNPPTSSNFTIDLSSATQFGGPFAVNDLRQDGFATGRLIGLDVADTGNIFARYTNGESQVLGQVALASFNDVNGLAPVGDTSWVETFSSGNPIIGAPGTATLGTIRASSLEESNVELSEQLVNLIIAQRNYQANAKTIESANTVTQTIINLR